MFHDFFWGGILFAWIFRLVFVGLIVWLIVNAVSNNKHPRNIPYQSETALDILKKRYAKGEVSKEQFEQMKRDIQ